PQIAYYSWQEGNGYVSGNNAYGDLGAVQKFDASYGVNGTGTIDAVKMYIPYKSNTSGSGTITVGVWEDNGGNLGALLVSKTVDMSSIDTTAAGMQAVVVGSAIK